VNLINQHYLTIHFPKFIFGIYKNQAHLCSHFSSTLEEFPCIILKYHVIFFRYKTTCKNSLPGYVFIMPFGRLGCWSNNRFRETVVLLQAIWHGYPTNHSFSCPVLPPGMSCHIPPDHHLHFVRLSHMTDCYIRIGRSDFPVGNNISRGIQKFRCYLI